MITNTNKYARENPNDIKRVIYQILGNSNIPVVAPKPKESNIANNLIIINK